MKKYIQKLIPKNTIDWCETVGVIAAMLGGYLVAANSGLQVQGYAAYTVSSFTVGYVCWKLDRKGLLFLQLYFLIINIIGIFSY